LTCTLESGVKDAVSFGRDVWRVCIASLDADSSALDKNLDAALRLTECIKKFGFSHCAAPQGIQLSTNPRGYVQLTFRKYKTAPVAAVLAAIV
jgi:hypothetical protein